MKTLPLRWIALAAWAVALLAVAITVSIPAKSGKLYPTFVAAGDHFRHGQPIYGHIPDGQDQYRYSPLVAAAFAPWGFLPNWAGAVLWRWLQAAAFLMALRAWARTCVPARLKSSPVPAGRGPEPEALARAEAPGPGPARRPHPSLTLRAPAASSGAASMTTEREGDYGLALLCLPLVAGNVFNAQLNPIVLALMLAGVAAFSRQRYNLAAVAIAGAALVKVYPLALGLLLCVVEPRRFAPRLALAVALGGLLPFALQSEEYVTQQFADWMDRVGDDDRTEQPIHKGYFDFQKLLRRWGLPTTLAAYREMEVAAGCLFAVLVLWGRRLGWDRARQVQACTGLGLVWCTLFGPATESATYMLVAPVAALAVVAVARRPIWERAWVCGAYLLLVSVQIAAWFPRPVSDPYRALVPQAHGALMLLAWLVWRAGPTIGGSNEAEPDARSEGDADRQSTASPVA